jgi:peptide/nickel transport system permease protein
MIGYVGRRLVQTVFVLWLAATLAFIAVQIAPGDPVRALLAASGASDEEIARRRARLGLDDPPLARYARYLAELLRGNLGRSWLHGRPVRRMIAEQLPATVELALAATAVGIALGVTLGTFAALARFSWLDTVTTALATVGLSTPTYWSGILAILLFSLRLRWFPATGQGDLRHLALPALVLGFALSGSIARLVRAHVVDVIDEPFVLAARARGLSVRRLVLAHVLRPALPPAISVIALQLGFLLSGAVVTESIFARQGLGRLMVEAILWRDLPVVRGVVVVAALAYGLANLAADVAQTWLDPRLREGSS